MTANYSTVSAKLTQMTTSSAAYLAEYDFNQDGHMDLLLGGDNNDPNNKPPIAILINEGDGSFRIATSDYFEGSAPRAHHPIATTADFNGDGIPDFAIYDYGHFIDAATGSFIGDEPQLFLSKPGRKWAPSSSLRNASLAASSFNSARVHSKEIQAGDFDGDGDSDLYIESGGGFQNLDSHFAINDGTGNFTIARLGTRMETFMVKGPAGLWRYGAYAVADMDNDGKSDLVMGVWRRVNNRQEDSSSRVAFNDGTGRFAMANSTGLPIVGWNSGWTRTQKVIAVDLNDDGLLDIVMAHTREFDAARPQEFVQGLHFQVLLNKGNRTFEDATGRFFLDQAAHESLFIEPYTNNVNTPDKLLYRDVNGDGLKDLICAGASAHLSDVSPAIYLRTVSGYFEPINYRTLAGSSTHSGEVLYPIDLNADGKMDFVSIDLRPGPDNVYGTGDEYSVLLPVLATTPPRTPSFTSPPVSTSAAPGGTVVLNAPATGTGGIVYQWYRNGTIVAGATQANLLIQGLTAATAGEYRARATDSAAGAVSAAATIAVSSAGPTSRLSNLSVRTAMSTGQTLIVGFTMAGGTKTVLARAVGPTLASFGLADPLADPRLELFSGTGAKVDENEDWSSSLAATFAQLGAFPLAIGSKDAALVRSIEGGYSAQLVARGSGVVLVELYDAGSGIAPRLANLSARNRVGTGDAVLVAGFTLEGTGGKTLLVRAIGPGLAAFGVPGTLGNPRVEILRASDQRSVAENDDWPAALAPFFAQVGAFALPAASTDSALLTTLPPGGYSVQVSGTSNGVGEALVEVYELP